MEFVKRPPAKVLILMLREAVYFRDGEGRQMVREIGGERDESQIK